MESKKGRKFLSGLAVLAATLGAQATLASDRTEEGGAASASTQVSAADFIVQPAEQVAEAFGHYSHSSHSSHSSHDSHASHDSHSSHSSHSSHHSYAS